MVPWNKLPGDMQKAILTMILVLGGTSASCRLGPQVCDPAPPPATTPMLCDPPPPPPATRGPTVTWTATPTATATGTPTPMICDPPPPPPSVTPMICDPAPPPPRTVAPVPRFTVRSVQVSPDPNLAGAAVQGSIVGADGHGQAGLMVTLEGDGRRVQLVSNPSGEFYFGLAQPGVYGLSIEGDESSRLTLELELHDKALVEWVASQPESHLPLPLAEIRSVDIVWRHGLAFGAESAWPGAHCRWTASGGSLLETDDGVIWHPPSGPGRYLLQVVADWGRSGLAVDAAVLVVEDDGSVTWL